jgi:NtrC-family two-component system sensor histidine kinase KinB
MPYPSAAAGRLSRLWWSLAGRIWLTNLILVLMMAALGVVIISRLAVMERSESMLLLLLSVMMLAGLCYALSRTMAARLQAGYSTRVAELDRERSKTAAIIESIEDGLIVLDRAGAIVHINEVARAILTLEPDGVPGSTLEELARHNSHVSRLTAAFERDRGGDGAPTEFKVFIRGRDHTYLTRRLPWTGPQPARDGGGATPELGGAGAEPLGTIVLLQDVTFVRDQERARTNLIATLSHELKTPLTSLTIASDLLAESTTAELNPRQREILTSLREDVGRLQTIANDLLDASRSSAARISVERRPIMLDAVLEEVCRPLALQAEDKGIGFELTVADRPIPIWGDPIKLPWVVTNLVGNALRYTPERGRIAVELRRRDHTARIVVSDTGPGIARELLGRIFEPYAQFPDNPARAGSAGLGLYIAKEIVEAHDGRIFVESEPGHGSSFIVEIPLRDEALG